MRAIAVEAVGITKRFGSFTALDSVSLRIAKGTVHALLGENGAGKSTLVKCLLGYYQADGGAFLVDDREVEIRRPADADRLGLGMVYQHFTLVPSMTAAENLGMSRADLPQVLDGPAERAELMIGELEVPGNAGRGEIADHAPRLRLRGLRSEADLGRAAIDIEAFDVRAGEILGVAGISGNGQTTLVEIIGGQRKPLAGEIVVSGEPYHATREEAQSLKVRVLPEEPLRNACVPAMSVRDNLNLRRFDRNRDGTPRTWLDRTDMADLARRMIATLGIKASSDQVPISTLSGGNVQRSVLARELDGTVALLVVSNPCSGLDVKAVSEIRARIMAARNAGTAVLLLSEDLDEILELSDRIVVMRQGSIVYETSGAGSDARTIGGYMVGRVGSCPLQPAQ